MRGDELRHLEHVDGIFSAKYLLEVFVCIDVPFVFRVLQIIALNVFPQLLYYF